VSAKFVFGTDDPTQSVTDIFGFFVRWREHIREVPGGELISNTAGQPDEVHPQPRRQRLYGIEYNGLSQAFTVVGLRRTQRARRTPIMIGVADTSDSIYDSGVFIGGLLAGTDTGGGIGGEVPSR